MTDIERLTREANHWRGRFLLAMEEHFDGKRTEESAEDVNRRYTAAQRALVVAQQARQIDRIERATEHLEAMLSSLPSARLAEISRAGNPADSEVADEYLYQRGEMVCESCDAVIPLATGPYAAIFCHECDGGIDTTARDSYAATVMA